MSTATTTAASGMVLGFVGALLAQQLGVLALANVVSTVVAVGLCVVLGGVGFGLLGWVFQRA